MERRARNAPTLLLAGALLASAALTLALTWNLTFIQDTWAFLIERREITLDTIFEPHNEHIVAIPALLKQLQLRIFGMDSARPEYVLMIVLLLVSASLLFVYLRRRVGAWPALFGTVLVLFLGSAWETVLWPFEIGFVGSILFGIATLLALEREDPLGDAAACLFLVLGFAFSSVGLIFFLAAAVAIGLGPRERWLARAYVVAVPVLFFVGWYLGWGHDAENHLGVRNLLDSPRYVAEALATTVGGLLGLGSNPFDEYSVDPAWGRPLLLALVAALAYRQWRWRPGLVRTLWPAAAALAAYWLLASFNYFPGREPTGSRYQYAGAVLLLMVLANLLAGQRLGRRALIAAGVVTVLAIGPNLVLLKNGHDHFRDQTVLTRADTSAIEIARETVDPEFELTADVAGTPTLVNIYAGKYLTAVEEYGSPAYSQEELASAPEPGRAQADIVLAAALPIRVNTRLASGARPVAAGRCELIPGGGAEAQEVRLEPGTTRVLIDPGPSTTLQMRRFAVDSHPVGYENVPGDSVSRVWIPADRSTRPWYLLVEAIQPVRVCR